MIVEHPKRRYESVAGWVGPCMCVRCDLCGSLSPTGPDIESAVDAARGAGYVTFPGLNAMHPRKWSCAKCVPKLPKKN